MIRVLIVDDHAENLYLLRALLQGNGCTVEEARNGAEALEKARRTPPDLVISDLLMPVLDGYSLLRRWKVDDRLKAIPFIVYTATYTDRMDERLALDLGADAFLVKPAEPEPFMDCVHEVMARLGRSGFPVRVAQAEDPVLSEGYSAALVRKVEKKARQLQQANRELQREITERGRSEAALRESEERYRNLFNSISDPLFVYDAETLGYLAVNDSAIANYGYSRDEFLAMTVKDIRPAEDVPALLEFVAGSDRAMRHRGMWRHRKKNGEIIEVEISTHGLDFSGRPAFVVQARDVTEQRRLEEQLRQAQKMEAVGQLAGGIAHDFNNLLTVINSYTELAVERLAPGDPTRELVNEIQKAGDRAEALTRQLQVFSRQQVLEPKVFDLNLVVSDTEKMLRRLIGEDIVLGTKLGPNLAQVKADPGQIVQVLINLAVNARDAMPSGGNLTIETDMAILDESYCRVVADVKPGEYVLLTVSDGGCGMDRATQARVFEPFFTTKGVGKGTGLGLAMVHGIIKQSHGHVAVYSEPGHGATFKVYLPPARGTAPGVQSKASSRTIPAGSETVLLVEDEDAVRELAIRILRKCGYRVLAAANGRDALRLSEDESGAIDLLVSDVVMPHLGGRALAEQFTATRPDARVLFLSGYTDDAVIRHGVMQAEFAFLQKPFTPASLAQKVRSVLDSTKREDA